MQAVDKLQKTHTKHVHSMNERLTIGHRCVGTVQTVTDCRQQASNSMPLLRLAYSSLLNGHVQIYQEIKIQ